VFPGSDLFLETTMAEADWTAADVDLTLPSSARLYDYMLGGSHNCAVDRTVAERIIEVSPDARSIAQANRSFLRRAVRVLVDAGIRQFLDLGSGIPTVGNVHEVAQQVAPDARVVYVDVEPVAVIHSTAILADNDRAAAIQADIRDIDRILADPTVRSLIDFSQPVGVLALSVLHFVPDEERPEEIIRALWQAMCPGSYLAVSHSTPVGKKPEAQAQDAKRILSRNTINVTMRSHAEVARLLAGFDLLEPGLVFAPQWRPDSPDDVFSGEPERSITLVAVGVKR
jgi:hypothetical protein